MHRNLSSTQAAKHRSLSSMQAAKHPAGMVVHMFTHASRVTSLSAWSARSASTTH